MAGSRLSVLQLLPALDGGGVERGTVEIASGLVDAGHRALVISGGGPMVREIESAGGEHLRWPIGKKSPRTLALMRRLRRLMAHERIDVVHARSRVPAWIAWLAWRAMDPQRRPRFVTTVHGFYRVGRYSEVMTRGERVVCVSESIRRYVLASYPRVDAARLELIPRGIDRQRFRHGYEPDRAWRERFDAEHPLTVGRRLLLLPGRLTRLKGHEELLALVRRLLADGADVHGLVAGGEDPRRAAYARGLRAAIGAAGLGEHISLLGHRDDLRELMAASDLVLSLSARPESFGRTTLEALSLGTPVLGYAHGGVGELLDALYPHGAVPPGDRERLAVTAGELLERPVPVAPSDRYSLSTMIERTLGMYERLVNEPRA